MSSPNSTLTLFRVQKIQYEPIPPSTALHSTGVPPPMETVYLATRQYANEVIVHLSTSFATSEGLKGVEIGLLCGRLAVAGERPSGRKTKRVAIGEFGVLALYV